MKNDTAENNQEVMLNCLIKFEKDLQSCNKNRLHYSDKQSIEQHKQIYYKNSESQSIESEFEGPNGVGLQISGLICKTLEGSLEVKSELGMHGQSFTTYKASFKANQVNGSPRAVNGSNQFHATC